jgi:hypothetical protein
MTSDRSAQAEHAGEEAAGDATPTADTGSDGRPARPETATRPSQAPSGEATFDWRGWLLVGVIVVSFLVVPVAILFLPQAQGFIRSLGLTLRDAYLTLPLIPAFLLGAVAVWAAVRIRSE